MIRRLAQLTALALALGAVTPQAVAADDALTAEQRYERGLKFMKRGNYTKALEELNRVRNYHRDEPVSVLAELAIADLHFERGEYEQARLSYEDFKRLHPRHEELDYVVYKIGLSIEERAPQWAGRDQTATQQAVNTWIGFSSRFPDSEHAPVVDELLAESRDRLAVKELHIARFYARQDAWRAVEGRTERLLKKYPDSSHVPEALSLRAQALWNEGQVDEAKEARAQLAEVAPSSRELTRVDKVLSTEPGSPEEDPVFFRPYRTSGVPGAPGAGR